MERDEKTQFNTVKPTTRLDVVLNDKYKQNINNIYDRVMLQMIEDALESGEPLGLLERRMWDPSTKTAKFRVPESTVLKLMYGIPLTK